MPKAYAYSRVSTVDQHATPESQAERCRDYWKQWLKDAFDWGEVFHDQGVSATKVAWQERPEGRRLLQTVTRGDIIITPMADRLFRGIVDQGQSMEFLQTIGVKLAILNSNVDTSTPIGEYCLTILTATARMESAIKSERSKMIWETRRRRKSPRKAHPPAGYYYCQKRGILQPDHAERKLLDQIFAWNDLKIQSIKKTCAWLRENDIKRRCGTMYRSDWVYQARVQYENNWPLEGYVRSWWLAKGDEYRQQRRKRLDKLKVRSQQAKQAGINLRYMRPDNLRKLLTGDPDISVNGTEILASDPPVDPIDT